MTQPGPLLPPPLGEILPQIDQEWARLGAAVGELAVPGLDSEAIVETLRAVGLTASPDIVTWFQWHNGISAPSPLNRDVATVPLYELLSLDQAIENTQMLRRIADGWEGFWPSQWLWLLSGHGGDCIAVDTASLSSTTYHKGRDHDVDDAEQWGRFDSLAHWADALLMHLRSPELSWRRFDEGGSVDGAWDLPDDLRGW